jgi:site-specific recombinase XerD
MLESGADVRFIEPQLGHVNLGMTEIYIQVVIVKFKQVQ